MTEVVGVKVYNTGRAKLNMKERRDLMEDAQIVLERHEHVIKTDLKFDHILLGAITYNLNITVINPNSFKNIIFIIIKMEGRSHKQLHELLF